MEAERNGCSVKQNQGPEILSTFHKEPYKNYSVSQKGNKEMIH